MGHVFRLVAATLLVPSLAVLPAAQQAAVSRIRDAVRSGDVAAVTALLEQTPALVKARDELGQTPLHWAANRGTAAMLSLLVERGADLNALDNGGNSALHLLASRGDTAGMTLLLDKGANADVAGSRSTPLHAAVLGRQVGAIRLLAGRKANLEIADERGRTPLVVAAREVRGLAVVAALLDLGAKVDAADRNGETALTLAAWRGSADVVSLLLARGASLPTASSAVEQLLLNAASTGLSDLFLKLVASGADLQFDVEQNRTLLHSAAEGGSVPIVAALLERRFEINRRDRYGWTPLHFAADMGRTEALSALLDKGADLNARTVMGQSAYNLAQDNDDAPMTALLRGKGADPASPRFPELRGAYMGQKPPGQTPEIFAPGIVSARYGMHSTIVFSPDGTEAFWSVMIPPRTAGYGGGRTLVSRLVDGRWTYPQRAVFDGMALDDVPFFHPDGLRLYDMSDRPLPGGEGAGKENIWIWQKGGSGWTQPRALDASVNRLRQHWQFSVDRAGTLYFASTWAGARGLFASRLVDGRYVEPEPLEAVFGSDAQFPFIAPDGSYLLFTRGMSDLCVSFRDAKGQWSKAVSLGPAFSGMLPVVSPDGKYLFFGRFGRVYWAGAAVIERLRPR